MRDDHINFGWDSHIVVRYYLLKTSNYFRNRHHNNIDTWIHIVQALRKNNHKPQIILHSWLNLSTHSYRTRPIDLWYSWHQNLFQRCHDTVWYHAFLRMLKRAGVSFQGSQLGSTILRAVGTFPWARWSDSCWNMIDESTIHEGSYHQTVSCAMVLDDFSNSACHKNDDKEKATCFRKKQTRDIPSWMVVNMKRMLIQRRDEHYERFSANDKKAFVQMNFLWASAPTEYMIASDPYSRRNFASAQRIAKWACMITDGTSDFVQIKFLQSIIFNFKKHEYQWCEGLQSALIECTMSNVTDGGNGSSVSSTTFEFSLVNAKNTNK